MGGLGYCVLLFEQGVTNKKQTLDRRYIRNYFFRLEFEQTHLPYYTEIDAVALLGE